ncbi:MAG: glycosyltransferase family 2 protein [Candidatus Eiseniibacteriota bacterium]
MTPAAVTHPAVTRAAVLVPAYNAAGQLGDVLARLARVHPRERTWVVNDGSTDSTAPVAEAAGVHVLTHPTNRGKGAALLTGFHALARAGADAIVTIDADGQHRPEDLPRLLAALADSDLVVGARVRGPAMPPHRRLGNALSAGFLTWLAGTPLPDVQSGYRAHRVNVLEALGLDGGAAHEPPPPAFRSTGYGFESEILIAAARLGFVIANVPIEAVYEGAPSHFRPHREVPRFVTLYCRLLTDAGRWSAHRRAREAAGVGRDSTAAAASR